MIVKEINASLYQEKTLEVNPCTYKVLKFLYCQTGFPYSLDSLSLRLGLSKRDIKGSLVKLKSEGLVKAITHDDGTIYYMYNSNIEEPIKFR